LGKPRGRVCRERESVFRIHNGNDTQKKYFAHIVRKCKYTSMKIITNEYGKNDVCTDKKNKQTRNEKDYRLKESRQKEKARIKNETSMKKDRR